MSEPLTAARVAARLIAARETSIVPRAVEQRWRRAPFERRAVEKCEGQSLPEWKLKAAARTLELNFDRLVDEGLSEESALFAIDAQ